MFLYWHLQLIGSYPRNFNESFLQNFLLVFGALYVLALHCMSAVLLLEPGKVGMGLAAVRAAFGH